MTSKLVQPGVSRSRTGTVQVRRLFIPLLMTILSQPFLTLMRRYFMTLPFFTTRHVDTKIFVVK